MCSPEKRIPGEIHFSLPGGKGGFFGFAEKDGLKITPVLIDIPKVHQEIPHIPPPTNKKSARLRKNLPVFPA